MSIIVKNLRSRKSDIENKHYDVRELVRTIYYVVLTSK